LEIEAKRVNLKSDNMSNNNVSLHKVIKATPEKVYRAFTEAMPCRPGYHPMDTYVLYINWTYVLEGGYKMSFTNFSTGNSHSFGGKYLEIEPNKFLKYIDKFDDPNLPGEMITSVTFKKVSVGTELTITRKESLKPYRQKCVI
jgi:uncharacterized protein YndB with AHSA1/START domain